ncbi:expressed unknown protein [Seminavis robusta]|uniref:Uncharacterized protein n=1 Tax=Seminavis robusta TaxID=568900 RepID=A0A9N8HGM3_9STRA|nr:expressed unknown protein [Seminavis robusta]|eukprot:Sro492_g153810.1 n/a (190) ;mRNA; r:20607-21176
MLLFRSLLAAVWLSSLVNAGKLGLVSSSTALEDDGDHGHGGGKGGFCLEKGIHCKGGFVAEMGGCINCEGHVKAGFHKTCKADEMADDLERHIKGQVQDALMDDKVLFAPDDASRSMMEAYDDPAFVDSLEVGTEKTVEFGGYMMAGFGCKVTFKKTDKGIEKFADCGGKFHKGHGKKPWEEVDLEVSF